MIWVEVFSAGCALCQDAIALVEHIALEVQLAGDAQVTVTVHDIREPAAVVEAYRLGIRSVPAVVVDGRLVSCEGGGIDEAALRGVGLGQPQQ